MKNKGFLLAETLVAVAGVLVSFVLVYIQFVSSYNISIKYSAYNNIDKVYVTKTFASYIKSQNLLDEWKLTVDTSPTGYIDVVNYCETNTNMKTCLPLLEEMNADIDSSTASVLFTKYFVNDMISKATYATDPNLSYTMKDFIKNMPVNPTPAEVATAPYLYRFIVQYDDGKFSTLKVEKQVQHTITPDTIITNDGYNSNPDGTVAAPLYQKYTVPTTGYYQIELWGAQGGSSSGSIIGGKGAYTKGVILLNAGEAIYLYAGKQGSGATGGYNGGGNAGSLANARGGGGASDVRFFATNPTAADLLWNSTLGLNSRIMVAAGGGGSDGGFEGSLGGAGGDLRGLYGTFSPNITGLTRAGGGGQSSGGAGSVGITTGSPGSFGIGGSAINTNNYGGGGGSGYYGGGSGAYNSGVISSGGGGSSFISGYGGVNAKLVNGTHSGNTKHYSNKIFKQMVMSHGNKSMPNPAGGNQTGNSGNGYYKVTYLQATDPAPAKNHDLLDNIRYIRDYVEGSTLSVSNIWTEIQAMKDGVNLAKGRPVTGTTAENPTYPYVRVTDGDLTFSNYARSGLDGMRAVTVDLGAAYNLDEIAIWHYYEDARSFKHTLYVSPNNSTWYRIRYIQEPETTNGIRLDVYNFTGMSWEYAVNSSYYTWTAPLTATYRIELWGAQGKGHDTLPSRHGGYGSYIAGNISMTKNEKLYFYIGGKPTAYYIAGYNGGGYTQLGGGGATDVRFFGATTPTAAELLWNSTLGRRSRIMVAAGGGGGGHYSETWGALIGGHGGTILGNPGNRAVWGGHTGCTQPGGGTQNAGGGASISNVSSANNGEAGSFGQGGNGYQSTTRPGGGVVAGGGGYYGGGSNSNCCCIVNTGGSGSSYISGVAGYIGITSASNQAAKCAAGSSSVACATHYSGKVFTSASASAAAHADRGLARITKQ